MAEDSGQRYGLSRTARELSEVERWAERISSGESADSYRLGESVPGSLYTVETFTDGGMHRMVAITVNGGSSVPEVPEVALDTVETDRVELRSVVRALLDLAGHEAGRARTSVVLTASGPRIVACQLIGV